MAGRNGGRATRFAVLALGLGAGALAVVAALDYRSLRSVTSGPAGGLLSLSFRWTLEHRLLDHQILFVTLPALVALAALGLERRAPVLHRWRSVLGVGAAMWLVGAVGALSTRWLSPGDGGGFTGSPGAGARARPVPIGVQVQFRVAVVLAGIGVLLAAVALLRPVVRHRRLGPDGPPWPVPARLHVGLLGTVVVFTPLATMWAIRDCVW